MKSKARFLPFVLALALLTSLFLLSPASAATGSVTLDKSYTTLGGMLEITVSDSDLDAGVPQNEDGYVVPAGDIAANDPVRFRTDMGEILDADNSLAVDYRDVVLNVDTSGSPNETTTAAIMAAWNSLTLEGADGARHPFSLENAQGGAFILRSSEDVTVPEGGITFTVGYSTHDFQTHDVTVRSTQDPTGITVTLMEDGRSTGRFAGSFTVDSATDADSNTIAGIEGSLITVTYEDDDINRHARATVETTDPSIVLVAPSDGTATQNTQPVLVAQVTDGDSGIDRDSITFHVDAPGEPSEVSSVPIPGGYRAEVRLGGVSAGETTINWSVSVFDKAGNFNTSDSNSIRIDTVPPNLESAATVDATSIAVEFNEDLNGGSLQASDFSVDGVHPADVSSDGASVTLKVPALAADARPIVEVVGEIQDRAGNIQRGGQQVTASDGIAPTLTVSIAPGYSDGSDVTIDIMTDEALLTVPSVTVGGDGVSGLRRAGDNHFRANYSTSSAGVYSVEVSGSDTSANSASASGGFEVDTGLPAPTSVTLPGVGEVSAGDGATHGITTPNPFITIEWDSEATEYDGDTHDSVEVTGLMLSGAGGESVDVKVSSPSSNRLLISARDLALGAYTLSFNGADDLGNTLASDTTVMFEVKEPDPFEITLTPGWNLVSLPAEPQMSGINDVIPVGHPASIVLTYDPTQPGAWLSASRGEDGSFSGTLDNISARTAYWVFTDAFDSLSVKVMQQHGGSPSHLPTINLVAGWNLLPVLDVTGGSSFGDFVSNYVGGVQRTYAYDASNDRFSQHSGGLQVGHGYWVYLSSATVLLP